MAAVPKTGVEDSRTRLIEAASRLMREEGYAAVTSRRVASKAGLKPQLVHYYFSTMDDLFLAILEQGAAQNTERLAAVLASAQPLQALWAHNSDPETTAITAEFGALANHRKNIRAQICHHAERFRTMHIEALSRLLSQNGISRAECPPAALAFVMDAIARVVAIEESIGMSRGHAETVAIFKRYLRSLMSPRSDKARKAPSRKPASRKSVNTVRAGSRSS